MKELTRIQNRTQSIWGDFPEKKDTLLESIEAAEKELTEAEEGLEDATNLEDYEACQRKIERLKLKVKFARKELTMLEAAPRMEEDEYSRHVESCKKIMGEAVTKYRKEAEALMERLRIIQDDYLSTAADVNSTLEALDAAANVLQNKYQHDVKKRQNAPDLLKPNRYAWKKYAVRFSPDKARALATGCEPDLKKAPHEMHDSILTEAWLAVDRGYPHRAF